MDLLKLRLSIIGTLAIIIGLSTLFFTVILSLMSVSLILLPFFVVAFSLIQWLIAPYLIDTMYRAKEVSRSENPQLYAMVERLSQQSGLSMPKVMIANIPVPNAFAYGSPIAGSRVAVTSELLKTLEEEEVEAVVGHELGHLKHRDVQVMMFVSILPAVFYFIYITMFWSSMFGSRRDERGGSAAAALIAVGSLVAYLILTVFTLYLSRLREYYADRHSASIVEEGPRKLSEGLAKIVNHTSRMKRQRRQIGSSSSFKALFIADPDRAEVDSLSITYSGARRMADQKLVEQVLKRKVTFFDRLGELFSSHPNIVKRLRALRELA